MVPHPLPDFDSNLQSHRTKNIEHDFVGPGYFIGDRKDAVCFCLHSQTSNTRRAAISALLDPLGQAFVLIQVLYSLVVSSWMILWVLAT